MKIQDYIKKLNTYYNNPKSVYQAETRLSVFKEFINDKDIEKITREDINDFIISLDKKMKHKVEFGKYEDNEKTKLSNKTKLFILSILRQMFMHFKQFELANEMLLLRKKFNKPSKNLVVRLDKKETNNLLKAVTDLGEDLFEKFTNKYLVLFLLDTGMKCSELCNIKPSDLKLGQLYDTYLGVKDKKTFEKEVYNFQFPSKGNKERIIYFHKGLLINYYTEYAQKYKLDDKCLFKRRDKRRKENPQECFQPYYIWRLVKTAAKIANISRDGKIISPHKLRSTYITEFVRSLGIEKAQKAAGHDSITSTRMYAEDSKVESKKMPNLIGDYL